MLKKSSIELLRLTVYVWTSLSLAVKASFEPKPNFLKHKITVREKNIFLKWNFTNSIAWKMHKRKHTFFKLMFRYFYSVFLSWQKVWALLSLQKARPRFWDFRLVIQEFALFTSSQNLSFRFLNGEQMLLVNCLY